MAMPKPLWTDGQARMWVVVEYGRSRSGHQVQKPGKNAPGGAGTQSASMTICSVLSFSYIFMLRLFCLMLLRQLVALAFSFALPNAGNSIAARIAIMART